MKNYLVKSLYKVRDTHWGIRDRADEPNLFEKYQELHDISTASYHKFLKGDWEYKFFGGEVDHIQDAFKKNFWTIYDLWHSEPCNIFYTDCDTLAIKDVEPWGQFDDFRMFYYTQPFIFYDPNSYNVSFDHYFNAGVRYYSANMKESVWELGAEMARNWDPDRYDTEQIIYNSMMWSQPIVPAEAVNPYMAYQSLTYSVEQGDGYNQIPVGQAKIIHFHSSRDSDGRTGVMKELAVALEIV